VVGFSIIDSGYNVQRAGIPVASGNRPRDHPSMRVSAWLTSSTFNDPNATVAGLRAAGITTANLMINDFSADRGSTAFRTFDLGKINAMARACHAAGIEVHLTSWVMPHDAFLDGALEQLPALLSSTGATMLWWDAEEPWTQATGCFDYAAAAEKACSVFGRCALSGIGGALEELTELAKLCCIYSPQAYATTNSQSTPGGVVPYSIGQWRSRFGEPTEGWSIGLAAYDQGSNPAAMMQPPIDDVAAASIEAVCYWTSRSIADDPDVCAFVAGLAPPAPEPAPPSSATNDGIMPTLAVASMPKGVRSQQLAAVQGLLLAWGVDPGPLDGLPGSKTSAGVQAFQSAHGLAVSGVVDGATWVALLRTA
jgi:hypothetical protein